MGNLNVQVEYSKLLVQSSQPCDLACSYCISLRTHPSCYQEGLLTNQPVLLVTVTTKNK